MPTKNLLLALAKVIIAAAWADGKITPSEQESLKDLLFRLPHMGGESAVSLSAAEWNLLVMMIETPITAEIHQQVINELKNHLHTAADKQTVLDTLAALVRADESLTDEEIQIAEAVEQAIAEVDVGLVARLGRLMQRHIQAGDSVAEREAAFADYLQNRVYYAVRQRLSLANEALGIPESELRKISLAGGLMAQIAYADRVVTEAEFGQMVAALKLYWGIDEKTAVFISEVATAQISTTLDYYRITREFFSHTSEAEREQFLDILFAIAAADSGVSHQESEKIRRIAISLNLDQQQFITARTKFA